MASTASTTSMASMTSTTSFHEKNHAPDGWIFPGNQMTNIGPFFVAWIIKNPNFY
jgi:hypothetical protein